MNVPVYHERNSNKIGCNNHHAIANAKSGCELLKGNIKLEYNGALVSD